jgi:hypothetical protein
MPTLVAACGFECGAHHNNGSAYFSGVSRDTTTFRSGLSSMRFNASASAPYNNNFGVTAASVNVGRIYLRFATLPNTNIPLICSTTGSEGVWYDTSEAKIYCGTASETYGASGVSVTTGVWYRIDWKFNYSANPWTLDAQVDGTALGQKTNAVAATTATMALGAGSPNWTGDLYYDDLIQSNTSGDYPLGTYGDYIKSYIPNADGAHNVAGANDFERSATGTDITNATTTAYQLIDDRPLSTAVTDYIKAIAPPNSTDYVEWTYEDSAESVAPDFVEAIVVMHSASSGTNNASVTLREHAGATSANIVSGNIGIVGTTVTSYRAGFATVPGTANAWTDTYFDALRSRFLTSDAAPDPHIESAMLEAVFTSVVVTPEQKNWIRTGHVPGMFGVRPGSRFGRTW